MHVHDYLGHKYLRKVNKLIVNIRIEILYLHLTCVSLTQDSSETIQSKNIYRQNRVLSCTALGTNNPKKFRKYA